MRPFYLLLLTLALAACATETSPRERLDFDTDPRIWRGLWQGESRDGSGPTVQLDLEAHYRDESGYDVSGTFALGDEEPLGLTGGASGGWRYLYVQPQLSDPCTFWFDVGEEGRPAWEICGYGSLDLPPVGYGTLTDRRSGKPIGERINYEMIFTRLE